MPAHLLSLAESARQIRAGALSPVDLVEALLTWIDAVEPQLQAWVTLDRAGALANARRCAEEARRGQVRGPLHGVPLGIKDIFFTAGLRTTCGSRIFDDFVPDYDATTAARLKAAGAIVLGKTHTTELPPLTRLRPIIPGTSPAPHGLQATGDPVFQTPWTFVGIPALTLPCGIADNGLPLGLQLASAPFTEARLLAVARWCERTLAFTARPALVKD